MRGIEQFMWGYQPHFRISLEEGAKSAFRSIGLDPGPAALLIGFSEGHEKHPICVEPENVGIHPRTFSDSMRLGDSAYEEHDSRDVWITHADSHERYHSDLRDRCRSETIANALNSSTHGDSQIWFVGLSSQVGDYRVYPALGVLRSIWESLPALNTRKHDHRVEMHLSLQEAVVHYLLLSASFALSISDQPQGLLSQDREEIVRRAATTFVRRIAYSNVHFMSVDLFSAMNRVAAQPYEGRTGVGHMLLSAESNTVLDLTFQTPIELNQTRALRKAFEMTDSELHLVTDGSVATGLGRLAPDYDTHCEEAFLLKVVGRGSWTLQHGQTPLLVVNDGQPAIPRDRLSRRDFDDAVERLFGADQDPEPLWALADAASRQAHGTMLVVHAAAAEEAVRLSPPAMRVEPARLSPSSLLAVSSIDGAILVDPEGSCHAVGTILDGRAEPGLGDASRGARFNSAHRYLMGAPGKCLIVIVSEDGMLNLLPILPRRVKRSYVERVVGEVESLASQDSVDFEAFHRGENHLRSLGIYLTPEQCQRANSAREKVERHREAGSKPDSGLGQIQRVGYDLFEPDPHNDDSLFLPEQ